MIKLTKISDKRRQTALRRETKVYRETERQREKYTDR